MQSVLDPKLLSQQRSVIAEFPAESLKTTSQEAYSIWAVLANVRTDFHIDTSDWHGGLAMLTPFGAYEGMFTKRVQSPNTDVA